MNDQEKKLRLLLLSGSVALTSCILAFLVLFHRPLAADGEPVLGSPQLVLFESDNCHWCEGFRNNIGRPYNADEMSSRAPLRYISVDDGAPPARYRIRSGVKPAAVVVFDQYGRELARYNGVPYDVNRIITMVRKALRYAPKDTSANRNAS